MNRKYITFKSDTGLEEIITFSELQSHSSIAQLYTAAWQWEVISAGFVTIGRDDDDGHPCYRCYGKSITLRVESRPDKDTQLLNRY